MYPRQQHCSGRESEINNFIKGNLNTGRQAHASITLGSNVMVIGGTTEGTTTLVINIYHDSLSMSHKLFSN